jgi:transcriptional regulator with XRE-family HTH domain
VTLGARVKKRRQQLGLTQVQLAQSVGVSNATIAYVETGRNEPQASTLGGLALALDVTADWLLWGREVVLSDTKASLQRDARRWLAEVEYLPESWKPLDWTPYEKQADAAAALAVLRKAEPKLAFRMARWVRRCSATAGRRS